MQYMRHLSSLTISILFLLLFSGCTYFGSNNCRLDRRTMVNILTDVALLESQLSQHQSMFEVRDSIPDYYAGIFSKYDITAEQFDKAFECYLLREEDMIWIMDEVLSSLSIIQSRIDERKAEQE
jgi:hypothetical protein